MKPILNKTYGWKQLEGFVRNKLAKDKTGHDYEHTKRVLKISLRLAEKYNHVDYDVLVASCFLHDISYAKGMVKNHHLASARYALPILRKHKFPEDKIKLIQEAILHHVAHMAKAVQRNPEKIFIEAKILRDADNLDCLGSIGIIRMILFSANQKIPYFKSKSDKLNESFYGNIKFLLDWHKKMLTSEGKKLAKERTKILKIFLRQIEKEHFRGREHEK